MVIDRDTVLKQAERLLRQGKLDGAIEEYVRLVADQPRDWSSINTLGDLYARAGRPNLAIEQYTRIADHLFAEEFLAKAAALYKKVLKTAAGDEHALLRLADITARQELFADARAHLSLLAKQRRERGDETGALDCLVRLGSLGDADAKAQASGGRAAEALHDLPRALQLYTSAAAGFARTDRRPEAIDALAAAVTVEPSDHQLRGRLVAECIAVGQHERARAFLASEAAGTDPELLLLAARLDLAGGREAEARTALTRLLSMAPGRRAAVIALADEMAEADRPGAAYECTEVVVDDAVLAGEWDEAIAVLQSFTARAPHVPALVKLVEVAIDAGRDAVMRHTQARLADAYIEAGRVAEARVVAEDLVAFDPDSDQHVDRLRRTLELLGVPDADAIIDRCRRAADTRDTTESQPIVGDLTQEGQVTPHQAVESDTFLIDGPVEEIDLSDALASLTDAAPLTAVPAAASTVLAQAGSADAPPSLEDVFDSLRVTVTGDVRVAEALDCFERAVRHLEAGDEDQAMIELAQAAQMPLLRFAAAARLGRLHLSRLELEAGVEWLERASEVPALDTADGRAVLYDLALALQMMGEGARSLAVLMEIEADAPGYRDVPSRIERLRSAGESS